MHWVEWTLALLLVAASCVEAEESAVVAAPSAAGQTVFGQQELDQLLAPIALYPDALLAQIFMASTYPLEVVEAARWVGAHPDLKGDQLQAALQDQSWDPSVKGLVMVPQVLTMMDEKLDWTEKLGDAFLGQHQAVMDTIQSLRARAQAAGNLASTPQQTVVNDGNTVVIEPANPEVIYVPVYNPAFVYGPWWWPAPPYFWYPPGYVVGGPFIYFGFGVFVGPAIWGVCDWQHRTVIINVPRYNAFNHTRIVSPQWIHDVDHRRGVPYSDDTTRSRFGRALPGAEARRDFRGYEQARQPGQAPRPGAEEVRRELAQRGVPAEGEQRAERPVSPRAAPGALPPPGARAGPAAPPPPAGQHAAPAFESFGRGDAASAYSNRGAASRGAPPRAAGGAGGRSGR